MKKLYDKDPVWFAVGWIAVYVLGFSLSDSASEALGLPKLITVLTGLILAAVLLLFLKKHNLLTQFGLTTLPKAGKSYLLFLPLAVLSTVNFWNGLTWQVPAWEAVLYVISMCLVALLEEVIFRGLLFRGMAKNGLFSAMLVSSLTFGIGHIVNLLNGAPVFETAMQIVYATAMGFCYTAVFYVGGSLLPCIVSHALVNATSIFAVTPDDTCLVYIALIQTVLGSGYGFWLLKKNSASK